MGTLAMVHRQYGCQPVGWFPEGIGGGKKKFPIRLKDSMEFLKKSAGLRQVLQRFETQDGIKLVVGQREGIGSEPQQGKVYSRSL